MNFKFLEKFYNAPRLIPDSSDACKSALSGACFDGMHKICTGRHTYSTDTRKNSCIDENILCSEEYIVKKMSLTPFRKPQDKQIAALT